MLKLIKSRKGATIIIIVIMMAILFPIIMSGIIDLSNIFKTSKRLKTSLNAATKSASTRIDWSSAPQGVFKIDGLKAKDAFKTIFDDNLGVSGEAVGDYYEGTSTNTGDTVRYYITIYNERHKGIFVSFPDAGTIPTTVTDKTLSVQADRPTVVGVATVKYKLSPVFGGGTIDITQFASAQLNAIPQDKQKSATYK